MNETYFVISNSDGDTTINEMNKETLLKRLAEEYWGDREVLEVMPDDTDTNYWGDAILIIKGTVVSPTPKQVVTEFEID